jgi:hypothetical protein
LLSLKSQLISSYPLLIAQENSLEVTTLTSLVEFGICSLVSAALGILLYIQGVRKCTTIASFLLFALCVLYKALCYAAYANEMLFDVSEADYGRLLNEAKIASKEGREETGGAGVQDSASLGSEVRVFER